jgi:hypothetical protein
MNITKMLAELRTERAQIEESIMVLERIARGRGKRRGRPPKWMTGTAPSAEPRKRTFSPEQRARMAAAQRKRRAAEKKAET